MKIIHYGFKRKKNISKIGFMRIFFPRAWSFACVAICARAITHVSMRNLSLSNHIYFWFWLRMILKRFINCFSLFFKGITHGYLLKNSIKHNKIVFLCYICCLLILNQQGCQPRYYPQKINITYTFEIF